MSTNKKLLELDHPCRQTCSGWQQGFDKGAAAYDELLKDARDLVDFIKNYGGFGYGPVAGEKLVIAFEARWDK